MVAMDRSSCRILTSSFSDWQLGVNPDDVVLLVRVRVPLAHPAMLGVVSEFTKAKLLAAFEPDALATNRPIERARTLEHEGQRGVFTIEV